MLIRFYFVWIGGYPNFAVLLHVNWIFVMETRLTCVIRVGKNDEKENEKGDSFDSNKKFVRPGCHPANLAY